MRRSGDTNSHNRWTRRHLLEMDVDYSHRPGSVTESGTFVPRKQPVRIPTRHHMPSSHEGSAHPGPYPVPRKPWRSAAFLDSDHGKLDANSSLNVTTAGKVSFPRQPMFYPGHRGSGSAGPPVPPPGGRPSGRRGGNSFYCFLDPRSLDLVLVLDDLAVDFIDKGIDGRV